MILDGRDVNIGMILFTGDQHWAVRDIGKDGSSIHCYNTDPREGCIKFTEDDVQMFFRWPNINDRLSKKIVKSVTISKQDGMRCPEMLIHYADNSYSKVEGRDAENT